MQRSTISIQRAYGDTERKIGKAIRVDGTGLSCHQDSEASYADAKTDVEHSLRLLQVDTIDVVQLRWTISIFWTVLGEHGAYRVLLEAREAGKVHLGVRPQRVRCRNHWSRAIRFGSGKFVLPIERQTVLFPTADRLGG